MAAGDLTTVKAVQADLGLPASDLTALQAWVTGASNWIVTYLNQPILTTVWPLVLDGRGGNIVVLPYSPVQSVALVKVDTTVYLPGTPGGMDVGYFCDARGLLRLRGGLFSRGTGNVQITYTSGYATVPPAIERACVRIVGWRYKERERIGQVSKSIGSETITYATAAAATDVLNTLDVYKRVVPM